MAEITAPVQTLYYTGPTLELGTSVFKNKLRLIQFPNAGGLAMASYKPNSSFPAFTELVSGRSYVVYSTTVPYEIPTTEVDARQPSPPFSVEVSDGGSGPQTLYQEVISNEAFHVSLPSFTQGSATLLLSLNGAAPVSRTDFNVLVDTVSLPFTFQLSLQHTAPFAGSVVLTPL